MKVIANVSFLFSLTLLFVVQVNACICDVPPPPCYEYWRTDAVFVGSVSKVIEDPDNPADVKVTVSVENNFKGMMFREATTENYGHSCAWDFEEGEKFLFYAELNKNDRSQFGTHFCHRTQKYKDDLTDFEFLNAVKEGKETFWIWATIRSSLGDTGVNGVRAELVGSNGRVAGISNEAGDIRLVVPGEGRYKVRVFTPKGMSPSGAMRNDQTLWKEQRDIMRGGSAKDGYIDYEVDVRSNRCGWIDLSLAHYDWEQEPDI